MQNQIFNSLQQIMSVKPNNGLSKEQWHFSELQKTEARQFRKSFPSEDHVLAYFAPSNWPAAIANPSKCLAFPSVTLAMIDRIYREGLSYNIVVNNIVGIFTITRPREPLYKEAIEKALPRGTSQVVLAISRLATLMGHDKDWQETLSRHV